MTHFFTLTTDSEKVIATIQNNGDSKDFKEAIETAVREHYSLDSATMQPANPNNFIGQEKEVRLKCMGDDEEEYIETINVVSVHMYGKPEHKFFQVQNSSGNPAETETNPEALFKHYSRAEDYIKYLVSQCDFSEKEFKIIELS